MTLGKSSPSVGLCPYLEVPLSDPNSPSASSLIAYVLGIDGLAMANPGLAFNWLMTLDRSLAIIQSQYPHGYSWETSKS